ncbi:MAG: hypothetical protein H7145_05320 [Akkermansiaceae bacterium]|nr:hypothetical protein [Armatimonadota bacterium]
MFYGKEYPGLISDTGDAFYMALETITREEFDRRLEAANKRLHEEAETLTAQNEALAQLTTCYKDTLRELEAQAKPSNESF